MIVTRGFGSNLILTRGYGVRWLREYLRKTSSVTKNIKLLSTIKKSTTIDSKI